ncbi:MAG TPA: methyltransferase domain-containing protein [bacterium]|nr:methyltransferase domain-containing protein [bacterium]
MDSITEIDYRQPGFGDTYDELPLWSAPFGLLLLEHAPLRPGITVLDVGAGTGFLAMELAQRCGAASRVIAVDPWASALDRLRAKLRAHRVTNVEVREGPAEALEIEDRSVDLVVSNVGINNFEDPAAVLARCARAARDGARILVTTNPVGHMAEFYRVYRDTLASVGLADRVEALESQEAHRGTEESVRELLANAGFAPRAVHRDSFRMRFADGSSLLRHYLVRVGFLGGWTSVLPADRRDEVLARLESDLNAHAAEHGELALTIPMLCIDGAKGAPA